VERRLVGCLFVVRGEYSCCGGVEGCGSGVGGLARCWVLRERALAGCDRCGCGWWVVSLRVRSSSNYLCGLVGVGGGGGVGVRP
jgi:hypothetical protein